MDSITLTLGYELNRSLQIGDVVLYKDISSGDIVYVGAITAIDRTLFTITCDIENTTPRPEAGDFIFFSKDNVANTSGIIGHYAEVTMEITPTAEEELFAVSTEIFISS